MRNHWFRRTLDVRVRTAENNSVWVEAFLSEGPRPLHLDILVAFPDHVIREARIETFVADEAGGLIPYIKETTELTGLEIGPGFVRKARSALPEGIEQGSALDALVECARMIAQVGTLEPDDVRRLDITDPRVLRNLDLTHWPQLENGCIPYSEGIERQFDDRGILAASRIDIYSPFPGQRVRFRRDKVFECGTDGSNCFMRGYLSDDIHELEVEVTIDNDTRIVEHAAARSIRSPYPGICDQPFPRVCELMGSVADDSFKSRVVETVGLNFGCVHLKDLILDLVRYADGKRE